MLGISTSSFYGILSTENSVDAIGTMGVGCAEVFLNSFSEYTPEYLGLISDRLQKNGLAFNSVHTLPTQFEPQLFAVTNRQRQDALKFFETVLEGASKGGCKKYVMHGKPYFKKNQASFTVDVNAVAEVLNNLCDVAEKYNMTVALENVHWAMCNNIEFVAEMFDKVPKLMFTLDIKQAYLGGNDYGDYISAFKDRLCNVHICDYENLNTRLPGKGEVDFCRLAEMLDKHNYSGNVILEAYSKDYKNFDELKECVEFCKKYF